MYILAGYNGQGVVVDVDQLSVAERREYDAGWRRNAFNQYASDQIPINRYVGDQRHQL